MAMGADRGIHVVTNEDIDSPLAAKALSEVFKREDFGLILLGKQSIDSDANQTGQLLAATLGLPQGCFASELKLEPPRCIVTREVDGGLETLSLPLPCVITTDLRLNQPRYASLPGIMKAKKKPMDEIPLESMNIAVHKTLEIRSLTLPPKRTAGKKVSDVKELVTLLQTEAKVL